MSDFWWGHLLRMGKIEAHPCLTAHFSVTSSISSFFICSKHIHPPNPPGVILSLAPWLPGCVDECGWSVLWEGNGAVSRASSLFGVSFCTHFWCCWRRKKPSICQMVRVDVEKEVKVECYFNLYWFFPYAVRISFFRNPVTVDIMLAQMWQNCPLMESSCQKCN